MIEIPLTRGFVAIVDNIDADLAVFNWHAQASDGRGCIYVSRYVGCEGGAQRNELLHRVIAARVFGRELSRSELVDHINGCGTDNRRSNLRLASAQENALNQKRRANNRSGYKGVSWMSSANKWRAQIRVAGRKVHLGLFDDPAEAHRAYCHAGERHHGEFFNAGVEGATSGGK